MEKIIDIRPIKKKMRAEAKEMRRSMSPELKQSYDRKIKNKLLNLWAVREASTVLCYVSFRLCSRQICRTFHNFWTGNGAPVQPLECIAF